MEKLFSFLIIISSVLVFINGNPVHSVLYLILLFINGSGLLLLLGFEFLSMVLLVVYVGAIAVLFLFIVMMMNLKGLNLRKSLISYYPFGIMIIIMVFIELKQKKYDLSAQYVDWSDVIMRETNIIQLGEVLYTHYGIPFLISGYILLVAMIGAIYLTYLKKEEIKKQEIYIQTSRKKRESLEYWK